MSFGSVNNRAQFNSPFVCKDMIHESALDQIENMSQKEIIDTVLSKYAPGRNGASSRVQNFLQFPGLKNLGNTCFANSVLQCLLHTKYIQAYCSQSFHSKYCMSKIKQVFDQELIGPNEVGADTEPSTQNSNRRISSERASKVPKVVQSSQQLKSLIANSKFV